jgi:hypothetical protein
MVTLASSGPVLQSSPLIEGIGIRVGVGGEEVGVGGASDAVEVGPRRGGVRTGTDVGVGLTGGVGAQAARRMGSTYSVRWKVPAPMVGRPSPLARRKATRGLRAGGDTLGGVI